MDLQHQSRTCRKYSAFGRDLVELQAREYGARAVTESRNPVLGNRSNLKSTIVAVTLAFASLGLPAVASAGVYYPSGSSTGANDIGDLDHAYYYTWDLTGLTPLVTGGTTIISASITFHDLYNVNPDSFANVLHLDLLDNATLATGGGISTVVANVRSATDNATTTPTHESDMRADIFDSPSSDILDTSAQPGHINLTDRSFVNQGVNPTNTTNVYNALVGLDAGTLSLATRQAFAASLISPANWVVGTTQGPNGGYDYTYNFTTGTGGQIDQLIAYIQDGGDVALAFDPDCHYANDDISFTIQTGLTGAGTANPEPASLLLLGTGLVTLGRYRRKLRPAKK
jgi:hypothetical protein